MSASVSNFSGAVSRVKEIRKDNVRQSKEVVELWKNFISQNPSALGAEKWLTLEQVVLAALDIGDFALAAKVFEGLHSKFDGGSRIRRLKGMYLEAREQFEKAEELYREMLEEDPVDSVTQKRLACLCKSQGKVAEAVQVLNKYLEISSMDFEAWIELSDLYLSQLDYDKAAFCVEELILINPHNNLFHQRYADIKYSQGEFETARVYYSQAYRLSSYNVRALYGIILCCQKIVGGKSKTKHDSICLAKKALDELTNKFEGSRAPTKQLHQKAMDSIMETLM